MFEKLLTRYIWLKLSNEQRLLMRQEFNIPKSSGVEMLGNVMMSDGSNESDLKAVNVESMQKFLQGGAESITDFDQLFQLTIQKVDLMLVEAEKQKLKEASQSQTKKRIEEMSKVIENVIVTIENLPLDVQVTIINHFNYLNKKYESEENGSEEIEEGGNKLGTKTARGRSKKTETIG